MSQAPSRPRFLLFGDSLTQQSFDEGGWGARLTSKYQRKADITLRGYSGYNTRWALEVLDYYFPEATKASDGQAVLHNKYVLATVWFGANDAAVSDSISARQHIPIEEYKQNLNKIVTRLLDYCHNVIVITPPPVDEEARCEYNRKQLPGSNEKSDRSLEETRVYAKAAKEIALKHSQAYLDLHSKLQDLNNWHSLFSDGLHFTVSGNQAVFDLLMELIGKELPQLREDSLLPDFPWNDDIDGDDFKTAFSVHARKRE